MAIAICFVILVLILCIKFKIWKLFVFPFKLLFRLIWKLLKGIKFFFVKVLPQLFTFPEKVIEKFDKNITWEDFQTQILQPAGM